MWFLTLLLAFMASGGFACLDHCQCYPEALTVQMTCTGNVPTPLDHLPSSLKKLKFENADEMEVRTFLDNFPNSLIIEEIVLTNCSLKMLNVTWSGLDQVRELNLSHNMFVQVRDVGASEACNVTVLDLSGNQISDIGDEELRTFTGLTWLRISNNGLWNVTEDAFSGLSVLEVLDLSDNKLTTLPDNALTPLESLQKLDLSGNQLRVLGARWFESLGRLRELDVSRNGISRAASGVLQPLPGLSILRLSENPLRERDVSLLLGTGRRLETVDASHTGLVRVPAALTRSVRALRLAGNKLTSIRGGDLDSYPLLRLLDLSDNRLNEVEDDALGRLEVLEVLNLSGNLLAIVPHSLPTSLTELHIERNTISSLRFGDFDGLYNLRILKINDNRIGSIEEGSFSQLPTLEELSVSNNPIKALPANTFSGLTNLVRLHLSGLSSLSREQQEQRDMAFPVPTPERLTTLDVSHSPVLAAQLLTDDAALSACKSLTELNLAYINITNIKSDLVYDLTQLRLLGLAGNDWNCTTELYWLGEWIRQHGELDEPARCTEPLHLAGYHLSHMPNPPSSITDSPPTVNSTYSISPHSPTVVPQQAVTNSLFDSTTPQLLISSYLEKPKSLTNSTEITKINRYIKLKSKKQKNEKHYMNNNMRLTTKEDVKTSNKVLSKTKISELESRSPEEDDHHRKKDSQLNGKMGGTKEYVPLANDVSNTVAQELSGQVTDSGARVTDALSVGAHPGMLVLVGAALGAAAALTVVLSRRAPIRRRDQYQRQENIEVHSLTSTIERW
ncbi:insulin-like growth factor-binding protein complex acid labile subunit [Leptopilina boulardi]|uniref:insulin-like growth factor-binding protein complex acid labile subunit n=1 Tax=Leptopilina boulardi TaxID=63433 RepID=UPI0021F58A25|nr:insulin-like growth factor-binding protein complex acid labile subunit [Leptopilina boulardi]